MGKGEGERERDRERGANERQIGKVKIAYMGKILKDSETLQAQGWREGHVVNALVFGV